MKIYRALIIEDEPLMRQYLMDNLSQIHPMFMAAASARDGLDALETMEREKYDLLITDIRMPGLDGIALVKRLRDAGNDIPVIMLSGYDEFEYARAGLRMGVVEYLLKPLNDEEMKETLEKLSQKLQQEQAVVRLPDDWSPKSIQKFIASCFSETDTEQSLLAQRTANYIVEHFAEPITQSDVAALLGVTPAYLSSVFHEAKGESYTKFLTRVRMTQAALLLRSNPLLTVQNIAEMTGYVSDKHFISVFKKFFQVTPSEYRRQKM